MEALGKEGPRGQRRGRCENEGGAQDGAGSCRWEPGHLGSTKGRGGRKGARIYWGSKSLMLRSGEQSSAGVKERGGQGRHSGVIWCSLLSRELASMGS